MNIGRLTGWQALALRPWRWFARRDLQAFFMCVTCVLLYLGAIRPERERLGQASRRAATVQRERAAGPALAADPAAKELGRFYALFPPQSTFPDALGQLLKTAASHSLSLNEGEYTVTRETAGKLVRFQIVLPLRGNYPQVRSFLAALAHEVPGMALENAQFERRGLSDPALDVKLKFVLFLGRVP
jgi:hypothetical protein